MQLTEASTKITTAIVSVDPDLALRWLTENNTHNRDIKTSRVESYTADMLGNRWRFNGEPIQFSASGVLLNGQHRLAAVFESQTVQTFLIVRGLPEESQQTMDQGNRRTPSEQLKISGLVADNTTAAAIRIYMSWQTGRMFGDQVRNKITTPEIVQWSHANPVKIEALTRAPSRFHFRAIKVTPSVSLAVWLRLHEIDYDDADQFFAGLTTGANLSSDSPTLALLRRFSGNKINGVKVSNRDAVGFYVVAWNAFRDGRSMTKIQRPRGGQWGAQDFPEPK